MEAIKVRTQYRKCVEVITWGNKEVTELIDSDIKHFEDDLNEVLLVRMEWTFPKQVVALYCM